MNQTEQLREASLHLVNTGAELANFLAQLMQRYPSTRGWEDAWKIDWEEAQQQAQWDRLRQAWNAFTLHVMAEFAGVPVAPVTIRTVFTETEEEVRRIAGQIRDSAIAAQLAALGIALPNKEGATANG